MEIMLDIELVRHEPGSWWKKGRELDEALGALEGAGLWLDFTHVGRAGAKRSTKVAGRAALVEASRSWKEGIYRLSQSGVDDPERSHLDIIVDTGYLQLKLILDGATVARRASSLLAALVEATSAAAAAWQPRAWLGNVSAVQPTSLEYPHVRPPRSHPALANGRLVDFVDPEYHRRFAESVPEYKAEHDLALVEKAKLPRGARRSRRGRVIVLEWLTGELDAARAVDACARQERWIAETLQPPRDGTWNAAGDQLVSRSGLEEHAPLTLYDPAEAIGYKAAAANVEGEIDDPELRGQLRAWSEVGELPDGTPLRALRVIVPTRRAAVAMTPRADKLGVERAVYIDNQGDLWDPRPDGAWVEVPERSSR